MKSIAVLLCVLLCTGIATAAEAPGQDTTAANPYSGDILSRSTLTGDWGGLRNYMAQKGVTLDTYMTQVLQGVTNGGKSSQWETGGRGDMLLKVDTGKMGLWPGGFLTAELEGNWGRTVNSYTGSLMAVNNNPLYPIPQRESVALSALNFAQFLSPYIGVMAGKFDTIIAGDRNEFAHGKGEAQFMNLAFNVNPTLAMTIPYSTLGAGLIILPTKDPNAAVVTVSALSSEGIANSAGFSNLNANSMTFVGEARVKTDFFGKTGHQLIGYSYSNKDFTSLDQRLGPFFQSRNIMEHKGSWAAFYNFDQYIYEPEKGSGRGLGIFARFGTSDGDPNPLHYFMSAGVGGKGLILGRPLDRFGVGYYYIDVTSPSARIGLREWQFLRDEQGFEAFYNIAITPWAQLTPDIQVIKGTQKRMAIGGVESINTNTVLGLRLTLFL